MGKDDGKEANITPVFKKDKKEDPSDSQLLSLISNPGKATANNPGNCFQIYER